MLPIRSGSSEGFVVPPRWLEKSVYVKMGLVFSLLPEISEAHQEAIIAVNWE